MYQTKSPDRERPLIVPKSRKPRAKDLNDALLALGGGRMKSARDQSRAREKRDIQKLLDDQQ